MSANLNLIYSEFNLNVANDWERVVYVFDEYRLDAARRMLYRGEIELLLAPKTVETLLALIERRGEIVSKEELIEAIWGGTAVEESNLQHYLHVLRKTLGAQRDGSPFIETFRRRGYRFCSDVRIVEKPEKPKNNGAFAAAKSRAEFPREVYPNEKTKSAAKKDFGSYFRFALAGAVFMCVVGLTIFLYSQIQPSNKARAVSAPNEISVTNLTNGNQVFNAAISNDGVYFAYTEREGKFSRLILQQTGQTTRLEIVPAGERTIEGKTFSPNGEFIYFLSLEKGASEHALYRVPTLGGAVSKILNNVGSAVSFSPDGKEMIFARYVAETKEFQLVIADSDGGGERILLARSGMQQLSNGSAWSRDGKTIAFGAIDLDTQSAEGTCSILSVEIASGALRPISNEKWDNCFRMIWTRAGEGLVFIGTRAGESYSTRRDQPYYVDRATGVSRRIASDGNRYQDSSLGITDDGSILAVPHNLFSRIYAMNADGDSQSAVQITNGLADGRAGIAPLPDGRIGYITRSGENLSIWTVNADRTNPQQIFNEFPFIEELRASPDGRYFIFSARRDKRSHLYRLNTDGTNLTQLTDGNSYEIDSTISPDSRWIYFNSNYFDGTSWKTSLQKMSIDGGSPVRLPTSDDLKQYLPHVSPNGKFISDISADYKLVVLTADDGVPLRTFEPAKVPQLNIGAPWTPDSEAVTYLASKDNLNIWRQPIKGGDPQPLTDFMSGDIFNYAFSNDGKKLYISRGYQTRNAVLIKNFKTD